MTDTENNHLWRGAVQRADIPAGTKLVCYTIAQHHVLGTCKVSIAELAKDAALTPTTVLRHIRIAIEKGLLGAVRGRRWTFVRHIPEPAAPEAPPPRITLAPGTPQWEAWLHHYLKRGDTVESAHHLRRARVAFTAGANWPPESAEVFAVNGSRLVNIPWGTPEHVAWLCHYRRSGRAADAMAIDVAGQNLLEVTRWPPLEPSANKGDATYV